MRILSLLLLSFLLAACGKSPYSTIPENGRILAFGDSLTYGYNVEAAQSYPAVLAKLSGREVINQGVSGEITNDGLLRLTELLNEERYDFLILLEGGNDILQNLSKDQAKANLAAMIELAQQKNLPVLLIAVPEKSLLAGPAPFYQELADQYNVPLEKHLIGDLLKQTQLKSDSVHFNAAGYEEMAKRIHKTLKKHGAL